MGVFSEYLGSPTPPKAISPDSGGGGGGVGVSRSPADRGPGRRLWREVFGATDKEEGLINPRGAGERLTPVPGGSFGRSSIAGQASTKRLLEAFRSRAPGGWSDDRYEQTRHLEGIQYLAIHRTCEQLFQSEFQVFHRLGPGPDDKREVRPTEKEYELVTLLEKPNNDDTFGDLMSRLGQQLNLTGKALAWMVPNLAGTIKELYPVPTAVAIPQPAINPDYPDGYYRIQPIYPYGPFSSYPTPASAVGAPIPAQWMLEVKFPHPLLRYDGYSPLTALRKHIDALTMMDTARHNSMRRSINPSAVMNFEGVDGMQPLPDEEIQRIHAEWESEFMGPENAGKLIVGTPGSRLDPWGVSARDMDYQSGWDQLTSFIMAGFGITKPVAGMIDEAAYATLFAALKQFHMLTLLPICVRIAQKLTRHLAPHFGEHLIIDIRPPRIDDHDIMFQKITLAMNAKCVTKNQVLKMLELPLTHLPWGEEPAGMESLLGMQQAMQQGGQGAPGAVPGRPQPQGAPVRGPGGALSPLQQYLQANGNQKGPGPDEAHEGRGKPTSGPLGGGSLGPRKHLLLGRVGGILARRGKSLSSGANSFSGKSTYDLVREVLGNV